MSGFSGSSSDVSHPPFREGTSLASDAASAAICSGASFSIYMLRELIGAGSMANVYRAHDARLRREVALKILNPGALPGSDGLARFLHEARMAAAVRHPNVVNIFDVGVHDGAPYIVMELLEGEALDVRLSKARALREPVLVDIALQLVGGLAAVHDAGVVHRDVRLSNVFVARGPDGSAQAKLLDFSISKHTHDNLRLTTHGRRRWAAMPLYTAPEVLLDGDATPHSDQYSLGVLLYECITGVNPFRADTTKESIELITTGQARPVRDQPIRPSRRLAAIIERAMQVYPERRFGDLRELGDALASLSQRRGGWPLLHRAGQTEARPAPRQPAEPADRRLGWALGAAVVVCSVAAPVWAWWSVARHRDDEPARVASPLVASDVPAHVQHAPALTRETGAAARGDAPAAGIADAPEAPAAIEPASAAAGEQTAPVSSGDPAVASALDPALPAAATPALPEAPGALADVAAADVAAATAAVAAATADAPPLSALAASNAGAPGGDGALLAAPGTMPPEQGAVASDGTAPPPDPESDLDLARAPVPGSAAALSRHERGTNGALIFD